MTQYPPPHAPHTSVNSHPTMLTVPNGPTSSQTRLQIYDLFQKSLQMQNILLSAVAQTALFEPESMDPSQYHQLSQQVITQVATQFHSSLRTAELSLHQLTYDLMQQQQQQMRDCWMNTYPINMENRVTESHLPQSSSLLPIKCPSSTLVSHSSTISAPLPTPPSTTQKRKFNETTLDHSTSSSMDASSTNKRQLIKQENPSSSLDPTTNSSNSTSTGSGLASHDSNLDSSVPAAAAPDLIARSNPTVAVTSSSPTTSALSQPSPSSPLQPSPTSSETSSFQPSPTSSPTTSSSSPPILPLTSTATSSRLFPHAITLPVQLTTSPLNSPQPLSLTRLSTGEQSLNTGIRMTQMSSPISSSLPLSQYQLLMQRQMRQRRGSNPDISPIPSSFGVSTGMMTTHPKSHSPSARAIVMPSSIGSFSWTGSESNMNTENGAIIESSTGQLRRPSFTLSSPPSGSRSLLPSWFTNNTSASGGVSPESGGGATSDSNTVTQLSSPTSAARLQSLRSSIFPSRSVGSTTTLLPPPAFSAMANNSSLTKEASLIPVSQFSPRGGPVEASSALLESSASSSTSNPPVLISTLQPPVIPMDNNTNFELTLAPFGATNQSPPPTTAVSGAPLNPSSQHHS